MARSRLFRRYFTIAKLDQEHRIVEGFASTEALDSQGDVVDADAIKGALPDYMQWANLREMHIGPDGEQEVAAVGTVLKAEVIDGDVEVDGQVYHNPLHIIAKVVDDDAWNKVKEGVYKGFSIGGKILKAVREQLEGQTIRRIVKLLLFEISLVDRPANPDAKIFVWKGIGMDLEKAAGDPQKIIAAIQVARNDAELAGDLNGAALYTQAIALVLQASGDADADEPEAEPAAETPAEAEGAVEGDMQMAVKPRMQKAGRAISTDRMSAMKSVVKTLLQLMADAGDAEAQKAVAAYGKSASVAEDGSAKMAAATGDALAKVLAPQFEALTKTLADQGDRLANLERQPAAGGPVLRPIAKVIAGQDPAQQARQSTGPDLVELRKKAATEPDPVKRAEYSRQVMLAEQATARR